MDVTPQLLHDVEFREAKRGGYNTQDVDEFLERLAVGIERQDAQLREARQRAEAAEARLAEAEQRIVEAERRAGETSDADETLKRTLVLAQRTADAAIREAEEQAATTLAAAQEQSTRMLAEAQDATAKARAEAEEEARRGTEEARARVLDELRQLESARDDVRRDVTLLEGHLTEQRDRLRMAIRDLQGLLDDDGALREVDVPVDTDVSSVVEQARAAAVQEPEPAPAPEAVPADDPSAWTPDDEGWDDDVDESAVAPPAGEDPGPTTEAVDMLAERDAGDDAYLAELRKAMTDESPLGPREEADEALFERGAEAGRSRFGRRR